MNKAIFSTLRVQFTSDFSSEICLLQHGDFTNTACLWSKDIALEVFVTSSFPKDLPNLSPSLQYTLKLKKCCPHVLYFCRVILVELMGKFCFMLAKKSKYRYCVDECISQPVLSANELIC
jgi:hypothetical protein